MKRWRKPLLSLLALALLGAAAYAALRLRSPLSAPALASAQARQGDFLVITRCRGELRARRSVQVNAPQNVPDLRIMWIATQSAPVQAGDVVVKFDQSSARQQLQEKEASLKQAQAALDQSESEARITAESDKRDLSAARYDVERAKLEVGRTEILSAIQGEEARINLALAERKLQVQQATVALHEASSRSRLASLERQRAQAQYEVDLTRARLGKMELRSPLSGVIVFLPNYSQGWMNAKPFKVGDQVWPGASLAIIPDLSTLEMEGKVEEIDRGRLQSGMDVRLKLDALPELTVPARLDSLSAMTQVSFDWPPSYSFRAYARLDKPDPRLRPEMNGSMDVITQRLPNAVSVPAKALFTRQGRPIVYTLQSGAWLPHPVEVLARNPDEVAVQGLPGGTTIALVEPGNPNANQPGASTPAAASPGAAK